MLNKVIKILGKLKILKVGSYKAKGNINNVIAENISSNFNKSGFYGEAGDKIKKLNFGRLILLIITYLLAGFFSIIILFDQGLSFYSLLVIFSWLILIYFVYKFYKGTNYLWKKIIGFLTLFSFLSFIIIGTTNTNNNIQKPVVVKSFTYNISKLTSDYQDAFLSTRALFYVDIKKISLEDYKKGIKVVIEKWKNVEKGANMIGKYNELSLNNYNILNNANAEGKFIINDNNEDYLDISNIEIEDNNDYVDNKKNYEVKIGTTEEFDRKFKKNLEDIEMKEIYAEKAKIPNASIIKLIQKHFGLSAKQAMKKLEDYQQGVGKYWNDEAKFYDYSSRTAKAVGLTSTIGLFVGGNIITLGGLTAATTTGGAIVGGISLGATHALGGIALALQITNDGVIISTGEPIQNKDFDNLNKVINTINTLTSIKDNIEYAKSVYLLIKKIPSNFKKTNPEDLLFIANLNANLLDINEGLTVGRDNISLKKGLKLKITDPIVLKKYFDDNYNFLKKEEEKLDKISKKKVIPKKIITPKKKTTQKNEKSLNCVAPYVKDGKGGCIAGSTYCIQHYTNMVYSRTKNYCVCKQGYVEKSHGVCENEALKLQRIEKCKSKCDFATNPETYTKCIVPCSNSCSKGLDLSKSEDVNKSRVCFEACKKNWYNSCISACK